MLPLLVLSFFRRRILTKTFFISLLPFIALLIYLFTLLGCISKGAGIENLYWVRISQNGTAGQPPVEVRIGYYGMYALIQGNERAECFSWARWRRCACACDNADTTSRRTLRLLPPKYHETKRRRRSRTIGMLP